jgi:hypothetical protein
VTSTAGNVSSTSFASTICGARRVRRSRLLRVWRRMVSTQALALVPGAKRWND